MEKTVLDKQEQYVEPGDPVHLEKSGIGDHAGLDDSNVCSSFHWSRLDFHH